MHTHLALSEHKERKHAIFAGYSFVVCDAV